MADDETIRISVDSAQAHAQFEALEEEVRQLEAELKTLNATAGVTNAEIEGTTRRLGEAKAKLAEAGDQVAKFEGQAQGAGFSVKEMTKSIGAGVSIIAILRDNLQALEPVMQRNKDLLIEQATAAGADEETLTGLSLAMDSLIHPTHFMANAIAAAAEGMRLFAEQAEGTSTVVANVADSIPQMLAKIEAARKAAADENKDSKKEEEDAAKSLAAEEAKLEQAAVKAAEARAAAEAKAAAEIVVALEKERVALDAKLAQDEARLAKSLGAGGKIDTSKDADAAKADVAKLRQEIQRLENQPMLNPDEVNKLNELKDAAGKAAAAARDLGDVFTTTADDFLTEAEAASAAGDAYAVYGDRLAIAARRHEDAMRAVDEAQASLSDFSDTADEAATAVDDVGEAAATLGDDVKKGADKAKDGLSGLIADQETVMANYNTIKGQVIELQSLQAQLSLE